MHVQGELFEKFQNETMEPEEMIAFLSHLEECDYCLNELAHTQECTAPALAPSYLKEQILQRAADPDVQTARIVRTTSRKMELFFYSLRTAVGVITALFLLFAANQVDFSALPHLTPHKEVQQEFPLSERKPRSKTGIYDFSQSITFELSKSTTRLTDSINGFTNFIVNGGK